ncbi:MAG: phenylalanine--tRNA ligase subunit beta, partial [Candidatus Omnitrophota bacterium]|nr:phenylalanine--tRNA ligase subunit beta [Candidatus Omnitrophota bacterium]
PVNNVVDITNFCIMELGQPLHAFDYDKLDGGKIIVRKARKGEEIITIDGIKRKLDENILVIADAGKPVAIAGVMGGKETEVTFSTKRILLESAYFDPPTIRMAAKKLGISTESSYRFERGVDLDGVVSASNRATALICDLAKAKAISKAVDAGTGTAKRAKITLRISKANKILGMEVPASKCASILKGLDLKVKQKGKDSLEILVPSFRADLKEGIDLIEEIARIYGYDKVPETLTKISIWGKGRQKSAGKAAEEMIRESLVGMGLNEVISHALISKGNIVNKIMNIGEDKLPKVQNPLSSESEALRPSALCGIMDVLSHNINRKIPDIRIFELGKSYFCKDDGTPSEKGVLAIALCGIKTRDWRNKTALDIFDLKGIVEALFEKLGISGYEFEAKASPLLAPSASSSIKIDGKDIGILGKLNKAVLDGYDIKVPIFVSELDLKPMCAHAKPGQKFVELPRYPSMIRDISLIVDDKISNSEITGLIKRTCGDLAVSVKPFDLYRGEQVPKGSKSILYSVEYRASDRTLTDEEVNVLDKKIREVLAERFNAKIR